MYLGEVAISTCTLYKQSTFNSLPTYTYLQQNKWCRKSKTFTLLDSTAMTTCSTRQKAIIFGEEGCDNLRVNILLLE
jgi:hypothetical protein